jgi:hypothetical protein
MTCSKHLIGLLLAGLGISLIATRAEAVPSFARQTGQACAACHTTFPELTAFGRSFKLNGYTLTGTKQIESKESSASSGLQLSSIPPISAMLQVSGTYSKANTPSTDTSLPDQLSLFLAGKITPHLGSFIQVTMEQGSGFSLDNTDIRYANHKGGVTYGLTLNNSPTVQDLWNSTPAWGYPWTHGAEVTSPVIADGLGQNVAGLGGYADWGNGIYTELSLYHDTNAFDLNNASDVRIRGVAPYYRLAWEHTMGNGDSLMLGTYGMKTSLIDNTTYSGPEDKYTDVALDTQYQHRMPDSDNLITAHASYTHEKQTLDKSAPGDSPTLKSLRIDGTYHWGYHTAATLAYAHNTGYNSAYDDDAWTAQVSYLPWQNTKLTLQYIAYTKLAGLTDSSVSDNNTLLLQGWFMW